MILVVDDHVDTRQALVRLLRSEGYVATGVSSGAEALALLGETVPQLAFLDYSMPEMDGLEVFRRMRRDPRLRAVPVIMFSAFDGPQRAGAIAAGVDAYIIKGSLDWVMIRAEIDRLAGPGNPSLETPPLSGEEERRQA